MAAEPRYFGRAYRLHFGYKKTSLDFTTSGGPALDIKFNVLYPKGATARFGDLSILGLDYSTISDFLYLSTLGEANAMNEMIHVRLDAGYFSEAGMVNVFDGFVWYATITQPPQMWVNLKINEVNPIRAVALDNIGKLENMDLRTIVETVLGHFQTAEGVGFAWLDETQDHIFENDTTKKTIDFGNNLTLDGFIKILNEQASPNLTFCMSTVGDVAGKRCLVALDKEGKASPGKITIDSDHGLLSVTGIDAVNGKITTFIDKQAEQPGLPRLELNSILNPEANGTYLITEQQYNGHFMGKEWYVQYKCSGRVSEQQ